MEVDEETLGFAAALVHQAALQTVEATADDAYLFAVDSRGDLIVAEVFDIVGLLDGSPEPLEVFVTHTQGLVLFAASHIAVLQQWESVDDGV